MCMRRPRREPRLEVSLSGARKYMKDAISPGWPGAGQGHLRRRLLQVGYIPFFVPVSKQAPGRQHLPHTGILEGRIAPVQTRLDAATLDSVA